MTTDLIRRDMVLDHFEPKAAWFARSSQIDGVHGIGHVGRVLVWANYIARQLVKEGQACDLIALRWAAALHDVRRYSDDSYDIEHGTRAARWIAENEQYKQEPFNLGLGQLRTVAYCCAWHSIPIAQAPENPLELCILKEAATLDFIRFGSDHFDDSYLQFDFSLTLVDKAQQLFELSAANSRRVGWWKAVRKSAISLGIFE
jgi:HD superfamily phosphodiesterase